MKSDYACRDTGIGTRSFSEFFRIDLSIVSTRFSFIIFPLEGGSNYLSLRKLML